MSMACDIEKLLKDGKSFDPFSSEGNRILRKSNCKVIAHYSSEGVTAYVGDKISNQVFLASAYANKVKSLGKFQGGGDTSEWLKIVKLDQPLLAIGERNNVVLLSPAKIPTLTQALEKVKFKLDT